MQIVDICMEILPGVPWWNFCFTPYQYPELKMPYPLEGVVGKD